MGSNTNRLTKERCLEAYNIAEDRDEYELLDIHTRVIVGKKDNRTRFYLKLKCNKCGNVFDSEYYGWIAGRRCKRCSCKSIHIDKAYSTEDAIKIAESRGYTYIGGECVNNRSRIVVGDKYGYRYNPKLYDLIRRNGKLSPFKNTNSFTIYNINKYCSSKNTMTILLDDEYISNTTKMRWRCGICGEIFERNWASFSYNDAFYCSQCSLEEAREKQKMPVEDVKKIFIDRGLIPLFETCNKNDQKLKCKDSEGYLGYISYSSLREGNTIRRFSKENIYTNDNIAKYCRDKGITTILLDKYNGNSKKMKWKCGKCGKIFETTWASFYSRNYHYCEVCDDRKSVNGVYRTFDYNLVVENSKKIGYTILSTSIPTKYKDKIICRDDHGYMYYVLCSTILKLSPSRYVDITNPYSIRNIKKYIKNNGINTELLSTTYRGANSSITLKCNKCGKPFDIRWTNFQSRKTTKCTTCLNAEKLIKIRRINWKTVVEDNTDFEYQLMNIIYPENSNKKDAILKVKHVECGRTYDVAAYSFKSGARCRKCVLKHSGDYRKDNICNFKKYVHDVTNGEYECIGEEYVNSNVPIKILHKSCGTIYNVRPGSFRGTTKKNGSRCPRCSSLMTVSYTHAILSLLFERYFIGVEFEYDAGFRTQKGGISRYDLYVEPLNLLIEWQSQYHDFKEQKKIDKEKMDYAIKNGYEFLALDCRDFKTIDYVEMFFPFLNEIPKDLNLEVFNKFNVTKAQELLDSGMSIKQAAKVMSESGHKIYSAIYRGDMHYPDNYFLKHKQNKEVVQLTLDGEFITEYESIASASRNTGLKSIGSVCRGELLHSGGYIWVYKDKYINGEYTLPKKEDCVIYSRPIVQLTLDGDVIATHSSQKDAGEKTGIKSSSISAGMNSNGYCGGYAWVYLDDYNNKNYTLPKKRRIDFTIVKLTSDYEYICEYKGYKEIIEEHNYSRSNICRALKNGSLSHNFRWMYKDDYEKWLTDKK